MLSWGDYKNVGRLLKLGFFGRGVGLRMWAREERGFWFLNKFSVRELWDVSLWLVVLSS